MSSVHTHPVEHHASPASAQHAHDFLGANHQRNERKVWAVIALTAAMMGVEIAAGTVYGSLALVADGWHMATHAGALLITALAYRFARKHLGNARFSFGTGKLGDLGGYTSALVLAVVALAIAYESVDRLMHPGPIQYGEAIVVAIIGLGVNIASAWLLKDDHAHHGHAHAAAHEHAPAGYHARDDNAHGHTQPHAEDRDNNLRAAYMHVLADALTSVLAIAALLLGRYFGWVWTDPAMGLVGSVVILRWSWGLMRDTARVLLDATSEADHIRSEVREALAGDGTLTDLHVWQVGPSHFAAIVALRSHTLQSPDAVKARLAHVHELSHLTVEINAHEDPCQ